MKKMHSNKKAVFIGGCPRSGTTMLGSMLGTHSECLVTPESHFKQTIPLKKSVNINGQVNSKKFIKYLKKSFRFRIWDINAPEDLSSGYLSTEDYREYLLNLVDLYSKKHNQKVWNYWIDHTPQNFQQALTLQEIFPNAKFIHIVRDPRAIFASVLKVDWGPVDAVNMAKWWGYKLSFALAFSQFNSKTCMTIRYEDLVNDPEHSLMKICEFIGINYQSEMIYGTGFVLPSYTKKQHNLVGKKPEPSRLDNWNEELSDYDIYLIEKSIGDIIKLFGYDLTKCSPKRRTFFQRIKNEISNIIIKFKKWHNFRKRINDL